MEELVGMLAVLGAFGLPMYGLKLRHEYKKRKLELEAKTGGDDPKQVAGLLEENRLLRERVENLETIVCSVDFELNKKLAKVIDEQRSLVIAPGQPGPLQIAAAKQKDDKALDRTATAQVAAKPAPLSITLEPGQVL